MASEILFTLCGPSGGLSFREVALKTFCGKPISHYSLAAALLFLDTRADLRADFVLNTDSGLLRETVTGLYPEVAFLQRSASKITASGENAARLDIRWQCVLEMEKRRGKTYDYLIDLDITMPLRRPQDIADCFSALASRESLDAVIAASKTPRSPYTDYARQAGNHMEPLVPPEYGMGETPPDCYELHGSVSCFRRAFFAREMHAGEKGDLSGKAVCDVCEIPDYRVGGCDATDGFPLYEIIGRHLFQNNQDYRQVRAAVR